MKFVKNLILYSDPGLARALYVNTLPNSQMALPMSGVFTYSEFGLKVFMDAHEPVTLEEGDRYPLGPPSYVSLVSTAARQSPKLLVKVRILGGVPNFYSAVTERPM